MYAAKDTAGRAQDERENLAATSSQREAEDADAQDAFRAMQAARRSISLTQKSANNSSDGPSRYAATP